MSFWAQNNNDNPLAEHNKNVINLKALCKHVTYQSANYQVLTTQCDNLVA